jgi:mitogen-activated protein kinase kinase kinase 19
VAPKRIPCNFIGIKKIILLNVLQFVLSLEENIVSIFMQFVPGGSIASILARFGALDEAVFRKYTKQGNII